MLNGTHKLLQKIHDIFIGGLPSQLKNLITAKPILHDIHITKENQEAVFSSYSLTGKTSGKAIRFTIDTPLFLEYSFHVPATSKRDLNKLIIIEAERILPQSMEHFTIAWSMKENSEREKLEITIVAIKTNLLKSLEHQCQAASTMPLSIEASPIIGGNNVKFPLPSTKRFQYIRTATLSILMLSFLYFLHAAPNHYLERLNVALQTIDEEIINTRKDTASLASLQNKIKTMQTRTSAIYQEKSQGSIAYILTLIAEHSPSDVTINELRLDGNRLFVSGYASSPEEWIISLAKQPHFENVSLSSVTESQERNKRNFEVRANVIWSLDEANR
jgi:Tfp pilus assembly protein PilN